ncbi:MAG: SDR family oxidoreductase [Chloroflexi bacterium]|nr:SDR family oxidoreductase [Chloroflexota bacterium]
MSQTELQGQVALVTGAGRGIGRSIALALARCGADVGLVARTVGELAVVRSHVEALGRRALVLPTDVAVEADVRVAVGDLVAHYGRLDILVNNAGFGEFGPLEHTSVAQWDRMMAVNARGAFLFCRESIPHLRARDNGRIVNIASVVGHKGYVNQAAYSASKHALVGMSKALAREVQADGIRVHVISPGGVDTGLIGDARPDLDRSVLMSPDEVAEVVVFLVTRRGNAVIDEIRMRRAASTPWD